MPSVDLRRIMSQVDHRPYPLPEAPYVMQQAWYDLLFAHWIVDARSLRRMLPPELELDLFDGRAYVGVVPFGMDNVRLRWLPPFPGTYRFLELNVRTYVRFGQRRGVFFFSLDAASFVAVRAARAWFGLPYFDARMSVTSQGAGGQGLLYRSERTHTGATPAELEVEYGPDGEQSRALPGSLEHWLTERYCLYVLRRGMLLCGEIHHEPWPLFPGRADFRRNTMLEAAGLTPDPRAPLLHFVPRIDVALWTPTHVRAPRAAPVRMAAEAAG